MINLKGLKSIDDKVLSVVFHTKIYAVEHYINYSRILINSMLITHRVAVY